MTDRQRAKAQELADAMSWDWSRFGNKERTVRLSSVVDGLVKAMQWQLQEAAKLALLRRIAEQPVCPICGTKNLLPSARFHADGCDLVAFVLAQTGGEK